MRSTDLKPGEAYAYAPYASASLDDPRCSRVILIGQEADGRRWLVRTGRHEYAVSARSLQGTWAEHQAELERCAAEAALTLEAARLRAEELEAWQDAVNARLAALGLPRRAGQGNPGRVSDGSAFRCVVLTADDLDRLLTLAERP